MSTDVDPTPAAAPVDANGGSVTTTSSRNAEASSSRVTLDALKQRHLAARRNQLASLKRKRDAELRELRFLSARQESYEKRGGPAIPPLDDRWILSDEDEDEDGRKGEEGKEARGLAFVKEYTLQG